MNHKGPANTIKAVGQNMGTSYGLALSKSMKHLHNTEKVILPSNRFGSKAGGKIMKNLAIGLKELDLS